MVSQNNDQVAELAKKINRESLQSKLEAEHADRFVAIEPESGDHFVAAQFLAAAMASRAAYPNRTPFVIRIGHEAAFHIGASSK